MVNFNKNQNLKGVIKKINIMEKTVGKDTTLKAIRTNEGDNYPGISIELHHNEKEISIVDIECDIANKKIIINTWENSEKPNEFIMNF